MIPVVTMVNAGRSFGDVAALCSASLKIFKGEYISILGRSGSGKSTLLSLIGLLDSPTSGTYLYGDRDVTQLSGRWRASIRATEIGFVFQSFNLFSRRSAVENVSVGLVYAELPKRVRMQRSAEALDRVGLSHRKDAKVNTLSGGEQQRVAIARAIVGDKSLILADEPTGNLDYNTGNQILDLFESLNADGTSIVMITHDEEAANKAQRSLYIHDGTIS